METESLIKSYKPEKEKNIHFKKFLEEKWLGIYEEKVSNVWKLIYESILIINKWIPIK